MSIVNEPNHTCMIRNIIFDMGGVLLRFEPAYFIERLGITGDDAEILRGDLRRAGVNI